MVELLCGIACLTAAKYSDVLCSFFVV